MHVAIDGPSGAGKSTIARALARKLGLVYLDTGAMYRAVGLKALEQGLPLKEEAPLVEMLSRTRLEIVRRGDEQRILLDGQDVSERIRTPQVSMAASAVSTVGAVRRWLVAMQQALAEGQDVVMDGRDIGTKVLPDAEHKFFLTADDEVRARRRFDELRAKGQEVSYEDILADLRARDLQDSTRAESPLVCAQDAITVDTSELNIDEVVLCLLALMGRA